MLYIVNEKGRDSEGSVPNSVSDISDVKSEGSSESTVGYDDEQYLLPVGNEGNEVVGNIEDNLNELGRSRRERRPKKFFTYDISGGSPQLMSVQVPT